MKKRVRIGIKGRLGVFTGFAGSTILIIFLVSGGCRREPWSAASNLRLTAEEKRQTHILTSAEQRMTFNAMASVVTDKARAEGSAQRSINRGLRFSDVELAAMAAAEEVEMAVVGVIRQPRKNPNVVRIQLRTIEEWPAELVVTRVASPIVYTAKATVGRFPEEPARIARMKELLDAFNRFMRKYGEKRSIK